MAPPPFVTYSWIGLTALTPLAALLITWTLVSIHKKRLKSILLLSIVYSQLVFQALNFTLSTLTLLKLERPYLIYISYIFNVLVFYKSMSTLSLHLEEFYKLKSPSNYILNINSSLLKYHLMVLFLVSSMGSYFFRYFDFIPVFGSLDLGMVTVYLSFHSLILLMSLFFAGLKVLMKKKSLDVNVIIGGTNSTSSSTNLFGMRDGCGGGQGRAATAVAGVNLIINVSLVVSLKYCQSHYIHNIYAYFHCSRKSSYCQFPAPYSYKNTCCIVNDCFLNLDYNDTDNSYKCSCYDKD